MTITAVCNCCKEELPLNSFTFRKDTQKFRKECNSCRNKKYMEKYREDSKTRELSRKNSRKYSLKKNYGLSEGEVENLLRLQDYSCKICKTSLIMTGPMKDILKIACIDHCHTSGKIRGILCRPCNSGLGHFKDSPELLRVAREYLSES